MKLELFEQNRDRIYSEFKDFMSKAADNGYRYQLVSQKDKRGYIANYVFGEELHKYISKLRDVFSSLPYKFLPIEVMHSTISVAKYDPNLINFSDVNQTEILQKIDLLLPKVSINFKEVLYNDNSVILAGYGNDVYWELTELVVKYLQSSFGQSFRYPKMTHITLGRLVNESQVSIDKQEFLQINSALRSTSSIDLTPKEIHFGEFRHIRDEFSFESLVD